MQTIDITLLRERTRLFLLAVLVAWLTLVSHVFAEETVPAIETLSEQLLAEGPVSLVAAANEHGDPVRGAVLFHQAYLACTKCHTAGEGELPLGPDLTRLATDTKPEHLLESVLDPSKVIQENYRATTIVTTDGKVIIGLKLSEDPQSLTLRDPTTAEPIVVPKSEIEEVQPNKLSIMPPGLMNQLASRQQFLDLARYLIEIAAGGPRRAAQLKPDPALYAAAPLPEYEGRIDHAGMIAALDKKAFQRGAEIYARVCANCHGTHDREGSLPTSLKFAKGKFKNGNDPYTMYQTLTRGFGLMIPQLWMVPEQKYDVIHYIREAYLKNGNPEQLFPIDPAYLARLPQGDTRGPNPVKIEPWVTMDYGPSLIGTYEIPGGKPNFAYKGIATRLDPGAGGVSRGNQFMIFDHDTLRMGAAWNGKGFIDWRGIHFNGQHNAHPKIVGQIVAANSVGPGWANPKNGSFEDIRVEGRDGRRYGPLPRDWAHYKGLYHHGQQRILAYSVGAADILEMPRATDRGQSQVFSRVMNIGPRDRELTMQVASLPAAKYHISHSVPGKSGTIHISRDESLEKDNWLGLGLSFTPMPPGAAWSVTDEGNVRLKLPAGDSSLMAAVRYMEISKLEDLVRLDDLDNLPPEDLALLTQGGAPQFPQMIKTQASMGSDDGPFAVDILTPPADNPWLCRVRLSGFDFYPDGGRAVVSSWDGNVWEVAGLDQIEKGLSWRRIASGLFQPLGVKIVEGKIYVTCRDQLVVLHDLNGDGETDFYENFNNDHQVTEHFHEFAMGLQADAEGNFYYAKSARHALKAIVPHHGTLLRVSQDGKQTDILATGFRAANGVCLNPDGSFIVTDQEGHWNPKNRINWVRPGEFYGNMFGYHDVTDDSNSAMTQPLCWITNAFDRSPAELLWVESKKWGPLTGSLLNLSYGYGKIYVVPHEKVEGQMQGGMCALDIPQFPTGVMRGRFNPADGQLYTCGMFAWGSNQQQQPGGFYRLRYTGQPVHLPMGLHAKDRKLELRFSGDLDAAAANDVANYAVKVWSLKRTANYGSKHFDEHPLEITGAHLGADARTITLDIPEVAPTWCMEITYTLKSAAGKAVTGKIHNTIHYLGK